MKLRWIFKTTLILSILVSSLGEASSKVTGAPGLVMSGYIDTQMGWNRGQQQVSHGQNIIMPGLPSGFSVYRGSMTISDEIENAELMIDIPFRQKSEPVTRVSGGVTITDMTNDFDIASYEAQAFVKFQTESNIFIQMGQFDSGFGFEGNDSSELFMTQFGFNHSLTPNTHTGLLVGYLNIPYFVHFIAANSQSLGQNSDVHGPQLGIRTGWSQEPTQFSIGVLYSDFNGSYKTAIGTSSYRPQILVNSVLNSTWNKFDVSTELNVVQSRFTQSSRGSEAFPTEPTFGMLIQFTYEVLDKTRLGFRGEYLKNDFSNEYETFLNRALNSSSVVALRTGLQSEAKRIGLGIKYMLHDDLNLKASIEWIQMMLGQEGPAIGQSVDWIQGAAGLTYTF